MLFTEPAFRRFLLLLRFLPLSSGSCTTAGADTFARSADCLRVCPEKQIIRFKDMAQTGRIPSGECLNCGRCIEVCPEDALHFRIPGLPVSKKHS